MLFQQQRVLGMTSMHAGVADANTGVANHDTTLAEQCSSMYTAQQFTDVFHALRGRAAHACY